MDISTRTSEGIPSECPLCGKQVIVSVCDPIGDAVCPHCGSLLYPTLQRGALTDDEKKLAHLGILIETNDQGEIISAELHGPTFNDRIVHKLAECRDIPLIKLYNTGFTPQGIERLRKLLPQSTIEAD
jgi:hypothetical protein